MIKILAVGYNAFDVVVPVPEIPPSDSKLEVAEIMHGGGGPAATAAVAMAKLGAQVELITVLAGDLPGLIQKNELLAAGVDLSHCWDVKGYSSPQAVVLVDAPREERRILWSRGDLPNLDPKMMDCDWLNDVDLLYLDSHEPFASAVLAKEAIRRGLPIVLDAGNVREGMADLVPLCSDVLSSTVFAPQLTGKQEPLAALRALAALGPAHVAMTFGKAGCLALWEGSAQHVPAFEVSVRDTTGAGDVFHAGYAFARATGRPWLDSLAFGSATAALKCRDWGGRRGLPTLAEVEELLRRGKRRQEKPPCSLG